MYTDATAPIPEQSSEAKGTESKLYSSLQTCMPLSDSCFTRLDKSINWIRLLPKIVKQRYLSQS